VDKYISIVFEPVDTLFFRGNRPFTAGVDTFAESVFPSPLTIYGAIGEYILKKNGTDIKEFLNEQKEDPILGRYNNELKDTKVKIIGPFLYFDTKVYFPTPANIYQQKGGNIHFCRPDTSRTVQWDIKDGLHPIKLSETEVKPYNKLLSNKEINRYLKNSGILAFMGERGIETIYQNERRFGHKLDSASLTVDEGFLYGVEHMRFKEEAYELQYHKAGLIVFVKGEQIKESTFMNEITIIGGEKRMARIDVKKNFNMDDIKDEICSKFDKRFLIYLATPAIFAEGFKKNIWFNGFKGDSLVGAAVNKPYYISGWKRDSVSKGYPRPIRKVVPAGSVYFFEAKDWDKNTFSSFYETYNFNESFSDEYPSAGFGIGLIGIW
jgi:CRISPR-associated protein Cmr3